MKRINLEAKCQYNDYRHVIKNDPYAFHKFAFAVDFRATTLLLGDETLIFFDRTPWWDMEIKIRP